MPCRCPSTNRLLGNGGRFGKKNTTSFRGMTLMYPIGFRDCFEEQWQDGFLMCMCIDGDYVYKVMGP